MYGSDFDMSHIIVPCMVQVAPAILYNDFVRLDRRGREKFLRSGQQRMHFFLRRLRCTGPTEAITVPHRAMKRAGCIGGRYFWVSDGLSYGTGGPTCLAIAIFRLASGSPEYLTGSESDRLCGGCCGAKTNLGSFQGVSVAGRTMTRGRVSLLLVWRGDSDTLFFHTSFRIDCLVQ